LGFSISAHYCADELASWSITENGGNLCPCNNKPIKKDCCENKKVVIKSTIDQKDTPLDYFDFSKSFPIAFLVPSSFSFFTKFFSFSNIKIDNYSLFHPPPLRQLPIYLLNSNFLI
jgi:hypothetical protein